MCARSLHIDVKKEKMLTLGRNGQTDTIDKYKNDFPRISL